MRTLALRALRATEEGLLWETECGQGPEELDGAPARDGTALLPLVPLACGLPLGAGCWLAGASGAQPPLQACFLSDSCGSWRETGTRPLLIALGSRIPASVCCL